MQQRQGDVFFIPIKRVPKGAVKRSGPERGILARGEATGHHHAVADLDQAEIYDLGNKIFLTVRAGGVGIIHQEHNLVPLAEGAHEVRIQTEEGPDEVLRNVQD